MSFLAHYFLVVPWHRKSFPNVFYHQNLSAVRETNEIFIKGGGGYANKCIHKFFLNLFVKILPMAKVEHRSPTSHSPKKKFKK